MGKKEDPAPVRVLIQCQSLSAVAPAIEIRVTDDSHVGGFERFDPIWSLRYGNAENRKAERDGAAYRRRKGFHDAPLSDEHGRNAIDLCHTVRMRNIVMSIEADYRKYKKLAELTMRQLSEAELASAADGSNTIAMLVWHLSGNLKSRFTDFLTTDGEKPWRNKDSEFQARKPTHVELLEKWNDGWSTLFKALDEVTDEHLTTAFITIRGERLRVDQALLRSLTHASYHVGQIIYLTKALRGPSWKPLK